MEKMARVEKVGGEEMEGRKPRKAMAVNSLALVYCSGVSGYCLGWLVTERVSRVLVRPGLNRYGAG